MRCDGEPVRLGMRTTRPMLRASQPDKQNGTLSVHTIKASGHVHRSNRPNTRLHPTTTPNHQINPCNAGAIHTGHSDYPLSRVAIEVSPRPVRRPFLLAARGSAAGTSTLIVMVSSREEPVCCRVVSPSRRSLLALELASAGRQVESGVASHGVRRSAFFCGSGWSWVTRS